MTKLRAEKLQALIQHELSNMLIHDVKDPRVKFVTITGVEVSNDLSYAKVYVSLYGSQEQQEQAWTGLQRAVGFSAVKLPNALTLGWHPRSASIRTRPWNTVPILNP